MKTRCINRIRLQYIIVFSLLFTCYNAFSGVPEAPEHLTGKAHRLNQAIQLDWLTELEMDINSFTIYQYNGESNNPDEFTEASEVYRDTITRREKNYYLYTAYVSNLKPGVYSFYVTAKNGDGESEPSNIFKIVLKDQPATITFNSEPIKVAILNELYQYQVNASASNNATLEYKLVNFPKGMTINKETGLIEWTPTELSKETQVTIKASIVDDEQVFGTQKYNIIVHKCNNPATITFNLKDEDGNAVDDCEVLLYKKGKFNEAAYSTLISNDNKIQLYEDGDFYIRFAGNKYESEWYKDASKLDDAQVVTINCGDEITINADLLTAERDSIYNKILFTSTPIEIGYVGEQYTYNALATHPSDKEINYELIKTKKIDMTIDSKTGVVTWNNPIAGFYTIQVKAFLVDKPLVSKVQTYSLWIKTCKEKTLIIANIVDQNGDLIKRGFARFLYIGEKDTVAGKTKIAVFENGLLEANLDEGSYYIHFSEGAFINEWYQDAETMKDATPVTIKCGETITINVSLETITEENYYKVSGTVLSAKDNSKINDCNIIFMGKRKYSNYIQNFYTLAKNGEYKIELSDKYEYYACAIKTIDTINLNKTNYLKQYYNLTSDPTEATLISLTDNRNDINFLLSEKPNYENKLAGVLKDNNAVNIPNATVLAYLVDTDPYNQDKLFMCYPTSSDANGSFELTNLIPGNYILFAYTNERTYIPGYYKENAIAVERWENASRILIESNTNNNSIIYTLNIRNGIKGNGKIHGKIHGKKGSIVLSEDGSTTGIAGAFVTAINSNNEIIDFILSDDKGNYNLSEMKIGDYKLIIDKVGYKPYVLETKIEDESIELTQDVILDKNIASVIDYSDYNHEFIAYPNPANEVISIKFNANNTNSSIKITNYLGLEVYNSNINSNIGMNIIDMNISNFLNGIYYITISNDNNNKVIPFTVVK